MFALRLFEFNDQLWVPRFMTSWMTGVMRRCHETTEDGGVWDPKIVELLERTGTTEVVDLCSGGGEPVIAMAKVLEKSCGRRLRLTLTDLIPNREAARMVARDNPDCLLRVPSPAP